MTSTFKIQRICHYCKEEFSARTTVTKYCSHLCNKKALKEKYKSDKVEASHSETVAFKLNTVNEAKIKDYLTPKEVAALLNLSITLFTN
ncbi:MAG: DNA-binding protein [Bacteroidetes bacterium]|nr:DNA-binding protein [Bacteroidota bacterium]